MKASIIITSFNRPRLLSFGLESLAKQGFSKRDVEVIVLNDGDPNDNTEGVCELFDDELNIKYFASRLNKDWRVPGFAINYGVRKSKGRCIFISCAEIYHIGNTVTKMMRALSSSNGKVLVIPAQGKDDDGRFLRKIERGVTPTNAEYGSLEPLHNIHLPFFMGMRRSEFINIGGYDEDFTGIGFDDNDFVHRVKMIGHRYQRVDCKIVHLYHPRLSLDNPRIRQRYNYNGRIFHERLKASPVRNVGRDWGSSF